MKIVFTFLTWAPLIPRPLLQPFVFRLIFPVEDPFLIDLPPSLSLKCFACVFSIPHCSSVFLGLSTCTRPPTRWTRVDELHFGVSRLLLKLSSRSPRSPSSVSCILATTVEGVPCPFLPISWLIFLLAEGFLFCAHELPSTFVSHVLEANKLPYPSSSAFRFKRCAGFTALELYKFLFPPGTGLAAQY